MPVAILGVVAVAIATVWLLEPSFTARRLAREIRQFEASLRERSVDELRDMISTSPYWDMTVMSRLRDEPAVQEFFRRFDAEEYAELLRELGEGDDMCSVFRGAELSIGYRGRPEIMDYVGTFGPVLKELRRRQRQVSSAPGFTN